MANAFNLTAQINIRGPSNVNKVVSGIQKQLNNLNANVNLGINKSTTKTLAAANKQLQAINVSLNKVSASATRANTSMAQFAKSANSLGGTGNVASKINSASKATQQLGRNAKISFKDIKLARTEIEEFGRQSALAIRRFTAFASVTSVIYGVNNAINRALGDFVKFDRQLVRISQVSGQAVGNLKGLQGTIGDLATSIGVSSSSLAEISVTLTQAGFSVREVQKALKALALTDVAPTFNNLNQTVEGSIALLRQFSIGAGQLEASLGSINAVAARFAVESSDIIAAIQRAGGVFAAASRGVSEGTDALNEFIAVFTAVRATTREGAETIATGLRTIFTRLQRESTIDALKEFGVSLQDAQGKFVGAYKAVQLLSEGLGGLDPRDIRFSKIVEELGGFRQIGKVIPLIGQFATAQKALTVAQQGQGSLAESNAKAQAALAIQFARVREEFLRLVRDVAGTDSFKGIVSGALQAASAIIKVADAIKGIIPVIGLLAAARGASALTQFTKGFAGGIRRTQGFATGGTVPGSGNTDSVPAMLTPGEFVLRKSAVKTIGTEKLHRMNKFGQGGIAKATVRKVVDGDTLNINVVPTGDSFNTSATRLMGYDAYETTRGTKKERDLGQAGKAFAARYYPKGKDVTALFNTKSALAASGTEKYGRYLYTDTKFGNKLVAEGLGIPYTGTGERATKGKRRRRKKRALGGSSQDTVPAMLTPGEFVMNAKSAKAVGYGNLRKMNTRPQGFNKGGIVGYNKGGLAGLPGRDSGVNLGSFTGQLTGLEGAFDSMGLQVDKITKVVMQNGKVSFQTYKEFIRQAKANIALAKSSAKTSADLKKVEAMEKQLMQIRKKGAGQLTRNRSGVSGKTASILDGLNENMFYVSAAAGAASVALESMNTATSSGAAAFLNTLIGLGLGASTLISTITALSATTVGQSIASMAAAAGLTGVGVALGPLTVAVGAVVAVLGLVYAGFQYLNAATEKNRQLIEDRTQKAFDEATEKAGEALQKLEKDVSDISFQDALNKAAEQSQAADARGASELAKAREQFQSGGRETGIGFGNWRDTVRSQVFGLFSFFVDSADEATRKNKARAEEAGKTLADIYGQELATQMAIAQKRFEGGATLGQMQAAFKKSTAPGAVLTDLEKQNAATFQNLLNARLKADQQYIDATVKAAQQDTQLTQDEIKHHRDRVAADMMVYNSDIMLASKAQEAAREQERLSHLTARLSTAFERMNEVVGQVSNRIQEESAVRQQAMQSAIARGTGNAIGSISELPNVIGRILDNPTAYSSAERRTARGNISASLAPALGEEQAQSIAAISTFDPNAIPAAIQDAVTGAEVGADPAVLGEAIGDNIAIELDQLRAAGAEQGVVSNLQEQGKILAKELARQLQGVTDPQRRRDITEEVTAKFTEQLDKAREAAAELAKQFAEVRTNALNDFAKGLAEVNKLRKQAAEFEQKAINNRRATADNIDQALTGFGPSVAELTARQQADTARLTGGATDPADIANNLRRLGQEAENLESSLKDANEAGDVDTAKALTEKLSGVNAQLDNNRTALEKLAESAGAAAEAALNEVNERKRLQDANRQFAETLLTSGPDELKAMDEALVRANQRLNGFIPQAGASQRKQFFEQLKKTGSVRQASAQVAANTRKEDLQFLQQTRDVRIFNMQSQGMTREEATLRANQDEGRILAQMGGEAGLGALGRASVGRAVATTMDRRNDPVMRDLVDQYKDASEVQAQANEQLGILTNELADGALVQTMDNLSKTIDEYNKNLRDRLPEAGVDPINANRKARGGLIYAANGQYVNFKPKGTDTVPAMLTPGEFVVNRKATKQNLGLLTAINGGSQSSVGYFRDGGSISSFSSLDLNKDRLLTGPEARGLSDPNRDGMITVGEYRGIVNNSKESKSLGQALGQSLKEISSGTAAPLSASRTAEAREGFANDVNTLADYLQSATGLEAIAKAQLSLAQVSNALTNTNALQNLGGIVPTSLDGIRALNKKIFGGLSNTVGKVLDNTVGRLVPKRVKDIFTKKPKGLEDLLPTRRTKASDLNAKDLPKGIRKRDLATMTPDQLERIRNYQDSADPLFRNRVDAEFETEVGARQLARRRKLEKALRGEMTPAEIQANRDYQRAKKLQSEGLELAEGPDSVAATKARAQAATDAAAVRLQKKNAQKRRTATTDTAPAPTTGRPSRGGVAGIGGIMPGRPSTGQVVGAGFGAGVLTTAMINDPDFISSTEGQFATVAGVSDIGQTLGARGMVNTGIGNLAGLALGINNMINMGGRLIDSIQQGDMDERAFVGFIRETGQTVLDGVRSVKSIGTIVSRFGDVPSYLKYAKGGGGGGMGGFVALNTGISIGSEGLEYIMDPEGYVKRKKQTLDAKLANQNEAMQTTTGAIGVYAASALEGFSDPASMIVQGGMAVNELNKETQQAQKDIATTQSREKRLQQGRSFDSEAMKTLPFEAQEMARELGGYEQARDEAQAANDQAQVEFYNAQIADFNKRMSLPSNRSGEGGNQQDQSFGGRAARFFGFGPTTGYEGETRGDLAQSGNFRQAVADQKRISKEIAFKNSEAGRLEAEQKKQQAAAEAKEKAKQDRENKLSQLYGESDREYNERIKNANIETARITQRAASALEKSKIAQADIKGADIFNANIVNADGSAFDAEEFWLSSTGANGRLAGIDTAYRKLAKEGKLPTDKFTGKELTQKQFNARVRMEGQKEALIRSGVPAAAVLENRYFRGRLNAIAKADAEADGGEAPTGSPRDRALAAETMLKKRQQGALKRERERLGEERKGFDSALATQRERISTEEANRVAARAQVKRDFDAQPERSQAVAAGDRARNPLLTMQMKQLKKREFFQRGGMVYASNGMLVPYRPQGTDTVPAMLTPGEFVVNRNATSQYLPVLRAINSGYNTHGQMVNHLARGGVAGSPQYLQNGGLAARGLNNGVSVNSQIGGLEELKTVVNQLNEAISGGTENMTNVATQISNTSQSLASGAQSLNEAGTNIPTQITQQQRLTVDHAGIPQNIGAEFGKAADYAIGQADSRSAQQLNDLNTANEGSLGLPPPNNNSTIR